jgi:hypothetical protein
MINTWQGGRVPASSLPDAAVDPAVRSVNN